MKKTNSKPLSIYIHIPFCRYKCPYCDFYVLANKTEDHHKTYVDYLKKEIQLFKTLSFHSSPNIQSIYFGGGTPSLIDAQLIEEILLALEQQFEFDRQSLEISLEANPEDITENKALAWCQSGINRITLGIQSLLEHELKFLGRQHQQQQALDAIDVLNQVGLNNIGIDLIYQLPEQNLEHFKKNLDILFTHSFTHLSLYGLTIEPQTPFAKQVATKIWLPLAEEPCEHLFFLAKDYLAKKGFLQYEISNFAQPGYQSKHNQCYWQQQAYWGLGASAHSYLPASPSSMAKRWWNPKNLNQYYYTMIDAKHYPFEQESLNPTQSLIEYIYTHLRTDGLTLAYVEQHLNSEPKQLAWQHLIEDLKKQSYLQQDAQCLSLSTPGQMRSDWICQEMITVLG